MSVFSYKTLNMVKATMEPNEFSEAVVRVAEGILKSNYPDGIPGIKGAHFEEYIRRFVSHELAHTDIGKLKLQELILLFEKYCEFEQMKAAYKKVSLSR